jgi:aminoglycoside phosphotransferase family enzyme
MPLQKGSSKKTIGKNISEFHKGDTYAATMKKFGKAKADKQSIAVAYSQARKSGARGIVKRRKKIVSKFKNN